MPVSMTKTLTTALKKIRDNEDLYEGCVKIAVCIIPSIVVVKIASKTKASWNV
jgi:hypothetical protein